jgi:hypothetical protein
MFQRHLLASMGTPPMTKLIAWLSPGATLC